MHYAPRFTPRVDPPKRAWLSLRGPAALVALAVVVVVLWRMTFGVDYTDESFYVGIPWRFALGDRPYVDELNVAQNAALFVTPFVMVFRKIAGSNGLFLYLRALHVLFYCGVGWSLASLARARLSAAAAILVGAACVPFIPYGLPGLSYNTLGVGFLSLGLFLAAKTVLAPDPDVRRLFVLDRVFWAGACHGAAAFAYPTFIFPILATALALFVLATHRWRAALTYAAGGVGFMVLLSPVLLTAGPAHVAETLAYSNAQKTVSAFNIDTLGFAWAKFATLHPDLWKLGLGVAVVGILSQRWPFWAGILVCSLPLGMREYPTGIGGLSYICNMAFCAPLFALMLRDRPTAWKLLLSVWAPSALAGVMVSLSSGNGANGAGVGLYPAAMSGGLFFALWVKELGARWMAWLRPLAQIIPALVPLSIAQSAIGEEAIYRDGKISELTERVASGPYRGLMTTPERKLWIETFMVDVEKYAVTDRSLFYYDFPAGYMFTTTRPLAASVWSAAVGPPRSTYETEYFTSHAQAGDAVFRFGAMGDTDLDRVVLARCDHVAQSESYEVWIVRPDGQPPAADPFALAPTPEPEVTRDPEDPDAGAEASAGPETVPETDGDAAASDQ